MVVKVSRETSKSRSVHPPEIPGQLMIPDPVFVTDQFEEALDDDGLEAVDNSVEPVDNLDDPDDPDDPKEDWAVSVIAAADTDTDTGDEPIAYRNLAEVPPGDLLVRFEAYVYEAKITPSGELQLTIRVPHTEKRRAIGITDYQGFMFLLEVRRRFPRVVVEDSDPSDDDKDDSP